MRRCIPPPIPLERLWVPETGLQGLRDTCPALAEASQGPTSPWGETGTPHHSPEALMTCVDPKEVPEGSVPCHSSSHGLLTTFREPAPPLGINMSIRVHELFGMCVHLV